MKSICTEICDGLKAEDSRIDPGSDDTLGEQQAWFELEELGSGDVHFWQSTSFCDLLWVSQVQPWQHDCLFQHRTNTLCFSVHSLGAQLCPSMALLRAKAGNLWVLICQCIYITVNQSVGEFRTFLADLCGSLWINLYRKC